MHEKYPLHFSIYVLIIIMFTSHFSLIKTDFSVTVSLYETRKQAESLHAMVTQTTEGNCVVKRGDRTQVIVFFNQKYFEFGSNLNVNVIVI